MFVSVIGQPKYQNVGHSWNHISILSVHSLAILEYAPSLDIPRNYIGWIYPIDINILVA